MTTAKEQTPRLSRVKNAAEIAQSVATVIAIICAGVWALFTFVLQEHEKDVKREISLKANITHTITHHQINANQTWVRVSIGISNRGNTLLDLKTGTIAIHQILPLQSDNIFKVKNYRADWPVIEVARDQKLNIKIEPGEDDRLDYDFEIPGNVQTAEIYSYFQNPENPNIGWSKSTVYDLIEQGDRSND
ncbi:MAG: hypothetical protein GY775_17595 [Candidatus Scalindua sp.]|nr:hypothetical protein [Candidatus Scalindua sp.]